MLKTAFVALGLGGLSGLGFAPLHWSILALLAYPCLYRLMFPPTQEAGKNLAIRASILIFAFYFGNYGTSLFWVVEAPAKADPSLAWVGYLFLFALPLLLSLFFVPCAFISAWFKHGYGRLLVFVALLSMAEFARGTLFSGFTWNMPIHLLLSSSELLQNVSWSGLYGGNLLVLLILLLPSALFYGGKRAFVGVSLSCCLIVFGFAYGWLRLGEEIPPSESHGVRLIQPNLQGDERWEREQLISNFRLFLHMSQENRPAWVKTIIWAEASLPFDFTRHPTWLRTAKPIIPDDGLLITGIAYRKHGTENYYNGMIGVSSDGVKQFSYDKHHLVPFGEYVPFGDYLPLPAVAARGKDYSSGEPPTTVTLENLPSFIPLICYEIIFPYLRNQAYDKQAEFILNISNDEWYKPEITKIPIGFHQHLQLARFAAVESGLPVIRGTSSGISAIIDSKGRILKSLPYNERGVIDSLIPPAEPSFALLHDRYIFLSLFAILSLAIAAILMYSRITKPKSE